MTSALIDRGGHRKISGGLTQPLLSFSVRPSNSAGLVQLSHGPIRSGYLRVKTIQEYLNLHFLPIPAAAGVKFLVTAGHAADCTHSAFGKQQSFRDPHGRLLRLLLFDRRLFGLSRW